MSSVRITVTDLLAALAAAKPAPEAPPGYYSVREIAAATGWSPERTRRTLQALLEAHQADVRMDMRPDMTGRRVRVPIYRVQQAA